MPIPPNVQVHKVHSPDTITRFAELIVHASADPAFYNNEIPNMSDLETVRQWFAVANWQIWLISETEVDIGYLSLHTPVLTEDAELFDGYLETDSYLLPPYRGRRLMTAAWEQVFATLPHGTHLVAEIWDTNTSSQRRLERDGWTHVGKYFWQDPTQPEVNGSCVRYTYTIGEAAP